MASLHAKISWERLRKIEKKKKNRSDDFLQERNRKFQKKKVKKFEKLENTIMASCRAKICWERPRKGENKKKSFR